MLALTAASSGERKVLNTEVERRICNLQCNITAFCNNSCTERNLTEREREGENVYDSRLLRLPLPFPRSLFPFALLPFAQQHYRHALLGCWAFCVPRARRRVH